MTELPTTELQSVIIKPDKTYKTPLILVILIMIMVVFIAGYFYYRTVVLQSTITDLKSIITETEMKYSKLESEFHDHTLIYDELVGEVNGYFRSVEFDCEASISQCFEELASVQKENVASESAQLQSTDVEQGIES